MHTKVAGANQEVEKAEIQKIYNATFQRKQELQRYICMFITSECGNGGNGCMIFESM